MSNLNRKHTTGSCDRYRKHLHAYNSCDKHYKKVKNVVVSKKNICNSLREEETCSMGFLCNRQISKTPKITTKSDITFVEKKPFKNVVDFCQKCGDVINVKNKAGTVNKINNLQNLAAFNESIKTSICKNVKEQKHIYQYYRNEQFHESSDSLYAREQTRGSSLKTIIEHPEKSCSTDTVYKIFSDKLESEVDFVDPDNIDSLKKIKEFRNKNYFECHSAKARISSSSNNRTLNHKCMYRFFLNDRLFPTPVHSDQHDNIRCMECQLPLKINDQNSVNGTIQAKVKLNNKVQDVMLMLPVKNSLIIQEKRKAVKKDDDNLYFGIIKLNLNGDSKFNRNVPSNSLALRYQKGYEEHSRRKEYNYESLMQDDIIIT